MELLCDLTHVCAHHTDGALEYIYKAAGEDPPDASIWDEHPNPYIRRIIDIFTRRGLTRLDGVRKELEAWIVGGRHAASEVRPPRPIGMMERWSEKELGLVRLYLESLAPAEFSLEDWLMLVDYIVQRYLPEADMRSEGEWLSTRSSIMGRLAASMRKEPTDSNVDRVLAALPSVGQAEREAFGMTAAQRAALDYGRERCCENVRAMTDSVRHRLRNVIMDYTEAQYLGNKAGAYGALQTKLLDEFGTMNRDWRRIAVTEAGENFNQGFVAAVPLGARLKRVEKYRGACAFCKSIDGKIVTVVPPDAPDKDGNTQIWVGKTNIGRSASPRKREGNALVDREPHERWWIAAGIMHPHCRGAWIHLAAPTRKADPKFSEWMDEVLKRK